MVEKLRSHKSCGAAEKKNERNTQHSLREQQTSFLGRKKSGRLDVTFLWSKKTSLGGCLSYGSRRSVKKNLVSNHYLIASSGWEGRSLGPHGAHQAPLSSLPSFSVHGILHARILEWVAISFSRGSSQLRNLCLLQLLHCRWILYHYQYPLSCSKKEGDNPGKGFVFILITLPPKEALSMGNVSLLPLQISSLNSCASYCYKASSSLLTSGMYSGLIEWGEGYPSALAVSGP